MLKSKDEIGTSYILFMGRQSVHVVSRLSLCKWWYRELTLKGKLKCYKKPMKDPLGVSPSKGNQGTIERQ